MLRISFLSILLTSAVFAEPFQCRIKHYLGSGTLRWDGSKPAEVVFADEDKEGYPRKWTYTLSGDLNKVRLKSEYSYQYDMGHQHETRLDVTWDSSAKHVNFRAPDEITCTAD